MPITHCEHSFLYVNIYRPHVELYDFSHYMSYEKCELGFVLNEKKDLTKEGRDVGENCAEELLVPRVTCPG